MAETQRRTGHRLGDAAGRTRVALMLVGALFVLTPLMAAWQALGQGWQPTGDVAIISLRALDVGGEHTPLLGQPTTSEEFTGTPANHPGPIEFWLLSPALRIFGERAGGPLAIAAVNAAALGATLALAFRRGGVALLALMAVSAAGLVHALGAASLYDPFNSELATYSMLAMILAAWSILVGDLRTAPLFAAAAAVVSQVHVAGAAFTAPLALAVAASVIVTWRAHRQTVRKDRAYLLGAAGLLALAWLPPLLHELGGDPSNLAALWEAATIDRPGIGLSFTLERLATAVGPVPIFLRQTGRFGFLAQSTPVQVLSAALVIAACATLPRLLPAAEARAKTRNHPGLLAAVVLGSTAFVVLVAAGQPPLSAFRADGTRWLWVGSLGIWLSTIWSGWYLLGDEAREWIRPWTGPVGVAVAGAFLALTLAGADIKDQRDGALMEPTAAVADTLVDTLPGGSYRVRFEGSTALVTVGPGIVYRLEAAGFEVHLDDNEFSRGYGPHRTDASPVVGQLRITAERGATAAPDEVLVAEAPIDPEDPESAAIQVFQLR